MPKSFIVEDIKPKNEAVIDILPKNLMGVGENLGDQLYEVVLGAGMYMGIPPHTYPVAGPVQSPYSP